MRYGERNGRGGLYRQGYRGTQEILQVTLQQNNDLLEAVLWSDFYQAHRAEVAALKGKVVILTAGIKYSDYSGSNTLNTYKTSLLFTV